ncbi:MAG: hypothetical protein AB8B74_04430 [Crocinitomicaceae bacterium]
MSDRGNLNSRFQDFGAAPSKGAWKNISAALPKKRKKKAIIWWVGGAGVAASILIGLMVFNPSTTERVTISGVQDEIKSSIKSDSKIENQYHQLETNDKLNELKIEEGSSTSSLQPKSNDKRISSVAKNSQPLKLDPIINSDKKGVETAASIEDKTPFLLKKESKLIALSIQSNRDTHLMKKRDVMLIEVDNKNVSMVEIEENKNKVSKWQIGGRLNSSLALNNTLPTFWTKSFLSDGTLDGTLDGNQSIITPGPGPSPDTNTLENNGVEQFVQNTTSYRKVNQPISLNVFGRLNLSRRFFAQLGVEVSYIKASHFFSYENIRSFTSFYSAGTDLKLGFKVIDRRRWEIDLAGGLNAEKVFRKEMLVTNDKPLVIWGPNFELGLSYHLNENVSLRMSPYYGKVLKLAENSFYTQFQANANVGIGFSLLKSW